MAGVKFLIQRKAKTESCCGFFLSAPLYIFVVFVLHSVWCSGCEMDVLRVFFCPEKSHFVLNCRRKPGEGKPIASQLVLRLGFLVGVLSPYFEQSDYSDCGQR
jgi:hypothetical protein